MTIMRVDQLLSRFGYCSRREARMWCNAGRVTLNQQALKFSDKVDVQRVLIDGEPIEHPDGLFILMHKPTGYVCSHDDGEGLRIYDLLPEQWRRRDPKIVSVGRLDKESSGLLLLTDQSAWVHRLTSPKNHVDKRYEVGLSEPPSPDLVKQFATGISLKNEAKPCLPAELNLLDEKRVAVIIAEGKYHQVRRMFAACGHHVESLHRTHFGEWSVSGLAEGEWKTLPVSTVEPMMS